MSWVMHRWYVDLAERLGFRQTNEYFDICHAWQRAEGGHATHNAWNTTEPMPGASDYNGAGVKNYRNRAQGVEATAKTLTNGYYSDLVKALRDVTDPYAVAHTIGLSPWGTNGTTIIGVLRSMGVPEKK